MFGGPVFMVREVKDVRGFTVWICNNHVVGLQESTWPEPKEGEQPAKDALAVTRVHLTDGSVLLLPGRPKPWMDEFFMPPQGPPDPGSRLWTPGPPGVTRVRP